MRRTQFLLGTVGGLAMIANAKHVLAQALAAPPASGAARDRVLVVVNLAGGNDGLNCVVPYGDPSYYRLRPSIAVSQHDVLAIDAHTGFNPQMRGLKALYDRGRVAVIQGVGYPNPDHSHFRSTEIWQTAAPDRYARSGWLGRYLDGGGSTREELFNAVAIAPTLPELFAAANGVPAIPQAKGYGLFSDRRAALRRSFAEVVGDRSAVASPYLTEIAAVESDAQRGAEELPSLLAGYTPSGSYPATPLGRSLALAAQLVASRGGTRIIYVAHGSYDTHISQQGTQSRLLGELSDGLKAFYDDLSAHGNDGRVLTMTFSEFGRRVAENGSAGTDHGEAAPLFLVGGGVRGGLYGTSPDLTGEPLGNVPYTVDFRRVYATILQSWLHRPAAPLLGGDFEALKVLS